MTIFDFKYGNTHVYDRYIVLYYLPTPSLRHEVSVFPVLLETNQVASQNDPSTGSVHKSRVVCVQLNTCCGCGCFYSEEGTVW